MANLSGVTELFRHAAQPTAGGELALYMNRESFVLGDFTQSTWEWSGDIFHQNEVEQSGYNFKYANVDNLLQQFNQCEATAKHLVEIDLPLPAYEQILKASHSFNLLDARQAISVTERQAYILRLRRLSQLVATAYYESRQALGFPNLRTAATPDIPA